LLLVYVVNLGARISSKRERIAAHDLSVIHSAADVKTLVVRSTHADLWRLFIRPLAWRLVNNRKNRGAIPIARERRGD